MYTHRIMDITASIGNYFDLAISLVLIFCAIIVASSHKLSHYLPDHLCQYASAKQNKDIAKITSDIRDIQKSINFTSNTLSRADAVAEELIFAVRPVNAEEFHLCILPNAYCRRFLSVLLIVGLYYLHSHLNSLEFVYNYLNCRDFLETRLIPGRK